MIFILSVWSMIPTMTQERKTRKFVPVKMMVFLKRRSDLILAFLAKNLPDSKILKNREKIEYGELKTNELKLGTQVN